MSEYIRREDALNALGTITLYRGALPYDTAVWKINDIPYADVVERKRGEWRQLVIGKQHIQRFCSECGYNKSIHGIDNQTLIRFNFCPHCGADMRGEV